MRCVHEASQYSENSFLTLTYDDDHLPKDRGLDKRHFQLFMKRLRKFVSPKKIRFFHCGEYGEKTRRPHYHALIFGYDFPDKMVRSTTARNDTLWTSASLRTLWDQGHHLIGTVTFESAAYVARYVLKKITGKNAELNYLDPATGVIRNPEYVTMSRRPGIGRGWYDRFRSDIYPRDYAVVRGQKVRPPKFYDGIYELENPEDFKRIKNERTQRARQMDPTGLGECGPWRLKVKENVKLAQMRLLSRNLEELE